MVMLKEDLSNIMLRKFWIFI